MKKGNNGNTDSDGPPQQLIGRYLDMDNGYLSTIMTIPTDEVIEAQPSAAPSFDFESFHRNMNQLKVQTAQVRRGEVSVV